MNRVGFHDKVKDFINQVCQQVKAEEIHREIKLELESHLNEIVQDKLAESIEEEEAVCQAIQQMGDPMLLGKQFHQAHKPRTEWSLIGLLAIFISIGLVAMYTVQLAVPERFRGQYFTEKSVYTCVGIVLILILYFTDYRKLKPFSWLLYILALLIMLFVLVFGRHVNGVPHLELSFKTIDFISITPYLLIISLAGIMDSGKWKEYGIIKKLVVFVFLPSFLYITGHSLNSCILYMFGFMVLLLLSKKNWKEFILITAPLPFFFILMDIILGKANKIQRLIAYFNPFDDPLGAGYMVIESIKAIRSAGWWGHGFAIAINTLPNIHSEMVFTYLIYSLGWLMAIIILAAVLFFAIRIVGIARKIKDEYAKLIVFGLLTIFLVQFIWNMLMSVGLLPMLAFSLPFISHGGTQFIVQLMGVGVILSIYRRKDMNKDKSNSKNTVFP